MLLGFVFLFLIGGFGLMVAAWVMMLAFLQRYPMPPAQTPADGWARWRQFMSGRGCPPEGEPQRKIIATMFRASMACYALMIVMFFAAGGPEALPAPAPR
ncbi:MAG: hypothetical protein IT547_14940 [Hyphomonadaceae bacterium]|jgi:hypothetical protein|nr:hypothetical protein [Hyphomonadaceae bacterium]